VKILVTGGGGTLGKPLTIELRDRGYDVLTLDLMHGMADQRCDIRSFRQLEEVVADFMPDYVYHLAAEFGRHNGDEFYEQCWSTNMVGTGNVIRLCNEYAARLIFASSSEIYGELSLAKGAKISEDITDETPVFPTNDYAISKWANELQIINAQATSDVEATRLRFFNAYGQGEHFHPYRSVVCLFCHAAMAGEEFTVFKGYNRTFMHIDDFIPTLANASDAHRWSTLDGSAINIGGTDYRGVEELAEIVLETTGASKDLVQYMPEDQHNVQDKRPSIDQARHALGHDPQIKLEDGVPAYVEWLKSTSSPVYSLR
jgi:dTDP-glucose 4,6-dehydratase